MNRERLEKDSEKAKPCSCHAQPIHLHAPAKSPPCPRMCPCLSCLLREKGCGVSCLTPYMPCCPCPPCPCPKSLLPPCCFSEMSLSCLLPPTTQHAKVTSVHQRTNGGMFIEICSVPGKTLSIPSAHHAHHAAPVTLSSPTVCPPTCLC